MPANVITGRTGALYSVIDDKVLTFGNYTFIANNRNVTYYTAAQNSPHVLKGRGDYLLGISGFGYPPSWALTGVNGVYEFNVFLGSDNNAYDGTGTIYTLFLKLREFTLVWDFSPGGSLRWRIVYEAYLSFYTVATVQPAILDENCKYYPRNCIGAILYKSHLDQDPDPYITRPDIRQASATVRFLNPRIDTSQFAMRPSGVIQGDLTLTTQSRTLEEQQILDRRFEPWEYRLYIDFSDYWTFKYFTPAGYDGIRVSRATDTIVETSERWSFTRTGPIDYPAINIWNSQIIHPDGTLIFGKA